MNKKITIALAIGFIVVLFFVFRSKIGQLVSIGNRGQERETNSPMPSSTVISTPGVFKTPIPSLTPKPTASQIPAYIGRPTEEVRVNPEDVKLFSESQKQEIYRSLQNLGKSVRENPDFFAGWLQLGLLKKNIGDYEGARDAWEYASIIRPINDISFANLGELYWRYLHLFLKSEANFKMAIKNNPHDPGTYASLSGLYFYSMTEKTDLADDILLQGLTANPNSIDISKALAALYERKKEYASAIEWWQKISALDPQDQQIIARIDELKKKLEQ